MKNRIFLTIVALVILPTALLSIMAGRAVRNRELVIMEQMKISASSMTGLCSENIDASIKNEVARIRSAVGSVLMRTASVGELAHTAEVLEQGSDIVDSVIVYHDPWDVIYPLKDAGAAREEDQPSFIELLRLQIAELRAGQDTFMINDNGVYYCFGLIPGRKDLYAGFRINLIGLKAMLDSALAKLATDDIILVARGRLYEDDEGIVIEDPLSPAPVREHIIPVDSKSELLAATKLAPPFTDVVVSAYARNPAKLYEAGRNQSRLLAWGIILLAGGILAGVLILIYQIKEEIRRTSARANYIIGISHDLRTPIASLKMMTESLYSGSVKNPEKRHNFLGTMAGECERLNRLVERVLYFVRFGEDALVFYKKTVDVGKLIRETVMTFSTSASGTRHNVEFCVEAPSNLPQIDADENALCQVLLNLLDNALKYGKKEGSEAHTRIVVTAEAVRKKRRALRPLRKWIRISVSDMGPGINASDCRKLFKPYFRAASARNTNVSGVGLGLALCRHIARAHAGWMEAENGRSGGAVFSIYLPLPY